jgi:hypothetical protein
LARQRAGNCVIPNVFAIGARIEAFGEVPDTFELVFDVDEVRRLCHVVWRNKTRIGGTFL